MTTNAGKQSTERLRPSRKKLRKAIGGRRKPRKFHVFPIYNLPSVPFPLPIKHQCNSLKLTQTKQLASRTVDVESSDGSGRAVMVEAKKTFAAWFSLITSVWPMSVHPSTTISNQTFASHFSRSKTKQKPHAALIWSLFLLRTNYLQRKTLKPPLSQNGRPQASSSA